MKKANLPDCLFVVAVWVLFSLLAIALVGEHPYLALAVAVLGGVVMGVAALSTWRAP